MKKLIEIVLITVLCFPLLGFGQIRLTRDKDDGGLWKSLQVRSDVYTDTLSLYLVKSDSLPKYRTNVFNTAPIMACNLQIFGVDSVDIAQVNLYQWHAATPDSNYCYVSSLRWCAPGSKTKVTALDSTGAYLSNITTSSAEITPDYYSKLEFELGATHKVTAGVYAIVIISTWIN